ncbi:MAG: hypothetical protein WDO13_07650 [Verrucomicrobiota bacterium]
MPAACLSTGATAAASWSDVAFCVAAAKPLPVTYCCGPIGGMNSGFSGASCATFSDCATRAASASSLRSVPEALPERRPKCDSTLMSSELGEPLVVAMFCAKRM